MVELRIKTQVCLTQQLVFILILLYYFLVAKILSYQSIKYLVSHLRGVEQNANKITRLMYVSFILTLLKYFLIYPRELMNKMPLITVGESIPIHCQDG